MGMRIDLSEVSEFMGKLKEAGSGAFKGEVSTWMDSLGVRFLNSVQDAVKTLNAVDSRLLMDSFQKGAEGNVFDMSGDGMQVEVGTNVRYAFWANYGHGQDARFVPGVWTARRFEYIPGCNQGMMLTERWVDGRKFFEKGKSDFQQRLPAEVSEKLAAWTSRFFGV